jgi:hypothetical protein
VDDAEESFFGDVVRARAGDEQPAFPLHQLHRAQVISLYPRSAPVRLPRFFANAGRVEHNRVEPHARRLHFAQRIEDVSLAELDVLKSIQTPVLIRRAKGFRMRCLSQ